MLTVVIYREVNHHIMGTWEENKKDATHHLKVSRYLPAGSYRKRKTQLAYRHKRVSQRSRLLLGIKMDKANHRSVLTVVVFARG